MPVGLIFFAVPEEASPFLKSARRRGISARPLPPLLPDTRRWSVGFHEVHVSGMGPRRAASAAQAALKASPPQWLITAGFAGGLNPAWRIGDVLREVDPGFPLNLSSIAPPSTLASFHCASHVAVTVSQKADLYRSTRCDAVEMESGVIRQLCRDASVPSATIRVISDTASQDLPLDFNALMTPDQRMDFRRLAWQLLRSPGRIPPLLHFQKQLGIASSQLAANLACSVFESIPPDGPAPGLTP